MLPRLAGFCASLRASGSLTMGMAGGLSAHLSWRSGLVAKSTECPLATRCVSWMATTPLRSGGSATQTAARQRATADTSAWRKNGGMVQRRGELEMESSVSVGLRADKTGVSTAVGQEVQSKHHAPPSLPKHRSLKLQGPLTQQTDIRPIYQE